MAYAIIEVHDTYCQITFGLTLYQFPTALCKSCVPTKASQILSITIFKVILQLPYKLIISNKPANGYQISNYHEFR